MSDLIKLAERCETEVGSRELDAAIINRLDRTGNCWLWTGALDDRGRGRVWHNRKLKLHHRAVWEILVGPIPDGALLCHHCDNPQCANPNHLYVGDGKSNVADMLERGRHWTQVEPNRARIVGSQNGSANTWSKGEGNPKAKLAPDQAAEIASSTEKTRVLAQRYGVNRTTIQRIRSGSSWAS